MNKISTGTRKTQIVYLLGCILPVIFYIHCMNVYNWKISLEYGSIILHLFWMFILLAIIILNFSDWDVFISKNGIVTLIRFRKKIEIEKPIFTVCAIPLISMFFNLYYINFGKEHKKCIFRYHPQKLIGLFSYTRNAKRIENSMKEYLKDTIE